MRQMVSLIGQGKLLAPAKLWESSQTDQDGSKISTLDSVHDRFSSVRKFCEINMDSEKQSMFVFSHISIWPRGKFFPFQHVFSAVSAQHTECGQSWNAGSLG